MWDQAAEGGGGHQGGWIRPEGAGPPLRLLPVLEQRTVIRSGPQEDKLMTLRN